MVLKWDVWKHKDNPRGQYTDRKSDEGRQQGKGRRLKARPSEEKQAEL